MKAQLWKIWVTEGVMGMIHNHFFSLAEVHIPELDMSINQVAHILCEEERYKDHHPDTPTPQLLAEIEIPDTLVEDLELLKKSILINNQIRSSLEETFQVHLDKEELSLVDKDENEDEDEGLIVPGDDLIIP